MRLTSGSRVIVIGGGPAGSFSAISLLREARRRGIELDVSVVERRHGLALRDATCGLSGAGSCNYCAGGISPRMNDVLDDLGITIPPEVVQDRVRRIILQSHWKNIELSVPDGRRMTTVYRGFRPRTRQDRHVNFDAFLLDEAVRAGARAVRGEVTGIGPTPDGRRAVSYRESGTSESQTITGDLVVFAGGVNHVPGHRQAASPLSRDLARMMPGFVPPRTRRTLIFELEPDPDLVESLRGQLHFILHGSRRLRIEMGSLMPKGRFVTVVLIGPHVDRRAGQRATHEIVREFLSLPHIERVLPCHVDPPPVGCICTPNMVVGSARNPFGDRVAVVGDMVTARLYKDGIYTAYLTASSLARAALDAGVDRASLSRAYGPTVRQLNRDQSFGRAVFLLNAVAFGMPILSRFSYQAVLRERRTKLRPRRSLDDILWKVASGDDGYRHILFAMLHPLTIVLFIVKGVLITLRNLLTEFVFGLDWRATGRHPTGISRERLDRTTRSWTARLGIDLAAPRDFRRMYSIRVRATPAAIFRQLAMFGDPDRPYMKPRFVDIVRGPEPALAVGSSVSYRIVPRGLSFRMTLERVEPDRTLVYRVADGFARGGVLVFDVDDTEPGNRLLSILVAFDFSRESGIVKRALWWLYRWTFPTFVHDVLWNHALCAIKAAAETPPRNLETTRRGGEDPRR